MFPRNSSRSSEGDNSNQADDTNNILSSAISNNTRKLAAKQLIERYYRQVTIGCENSNCVNKSCAKYRTEPLTGNEGAITALKLFKEKAELCVGDIKQLTVAAEEVIFLTEEKISDLVATCRDNNTYSPLVRILGEVFTSSKALNRSFLVRNGASDEDSLDLESVRRTYRTLFDLNNTAIENTLINSLGTLSTTVEFEVNSGSFTNDPNYFRQFLIIFENVCLNQPEYLDRAFPSFCKAISILPNDMHCTLVRIWSKHSCESLLRKVESLQHLITLRVIDGPTVDSRSSTVNDDVVIVNATKCLKLLYYSCVLAGTFDYVESRADKMETSESNNHDDQLAQALQLDVLGCRKPFIPFEDFINEPLNEQIAVDKDFTNYKTREGFSFMNYNFILSTPIKNKWMFFDNRVYMFQESRLTQVYSLLRGQPSHPYLKLTVHRENLIQDALINLEMIYQDNPDDLRKQLFVEFAGEQGLDEGGVSKEFFQLVVEQIFNPDYGMFTFDEDNRQCWFNQTSFESEAQFTLIGLIVGLAIYNNVILDVYFPMVVYRKLFGRPGTLFDLKDSHPILANSLQSMLDSEDDVEKTLCCTFSISTSDVFGNVFTYELVDGGKDISVTNENRQKFVDLYVDYILNKSIEKQFSAFKHGFDMVTKDSPLKQLFRPEEVELLVCGSKDFDFEALQSSAEYDGGFNESSPIIRWFWLIVHNFSLEQKKRLLMFITGSDRVPIGGLAEIKLIIARQGPDSDSLPTAHTCFNVLLIPDYSMKSKLEERLVKAITYSKGFGLI